MNPNLQLNSSETVLHVITPISGNLDDLSRLAVTRAAARELPINFIYVVDSNTDLDYERIIKSLSSEELARVEVIHLNVKSPGLARNAGLERIIDGWISFWDADDFPRVREFYEMVVNADRNKKSICAGGFEIFNQQSHLLVYKPLSDIEETALIQVGVHPGLWRFSFKRNAIGNVQFKQYRMAEDQLFLAELDIDLSKFISVENSVYKYVVGDPSQLTRDADAIKDIANACKDMYARIEKRQSLMNSVRTTMFLRQVLTGLKRLPIGEKIKVFHFTLGAIIKARGSRIQFFRSLMLILRARKS
jgi:glycosyltransferase involved in cell wall biosynthesis